MALWWWMLSSVLRGLGTALARAALFGALGALINWAFLFLARERLLAGPAPAGLVLLAVGLGLPLLWVLAGQQYGVRVAMARFYHDHRDDALARVIGRNAAGAAARRLDGVVEENLLRPAVLWVWTVAGANTAVLALLLLA
jgi:hypothetical protein